MALVALRKQLGPVSAAGRQPSREVGRPVAAWPSSGLMVKFVHEFSGSFRTWQNREKRSPASCRTMFSMTRATDVWCDHLFVIVCACLLRLASDAAEGGVKFGLMSMVCAPLFVCRIVVAVTIFSSSASVQALNGLLPASQLSQLLASSLLRSPTSSHVVQLH